MVLFVRLKGVLSGWRVIKWYKMVSDSEWMVSRDCINSNRLHASGIKLCHTDGLILFFTESVGIKLLHIDYKLYL